MTYTKFNKIFQEICYKNNIIVFFNDPQITDKDNGFAKWNEIHLETKYSNISTYIAVAFHEFAHAIINMKRAKKIKQSFVNCNFNEEFLAWALAMRYYAKNFNKPFNKTQSNFVLKCLKTHALTDYSFKDIYKDFNQTNK